MAAPLTTTPARAAARDAGHERDRRGQDQRARCRDDEDRERADGITGDRPGDSGDEQSSPAGRRSRSGRRCGRTAPAPPPPARPAARARRRRSRRPAATPAARTACPSPPYRCERCPPRCTVTGSGSPVSADSSTIASSLITIPSTGTTSPARTSTISSAPTSSIGSSTSSSPRRTSADLGARSTSAVSSRRARRFAVSSSALPPASISATTAPARYSPKRERSRHRHERDRIDADVTSQQRLQHRPGERHEQHRRRHRPQPVSGLLVAPGCEREAADHPSERGSGNESCRIRTQPVEGSRHIVRPVSSNGGVVRSGKPAAATRSGVVCPSSSRFGAKASVASMVISRPARAARAPAKRSLDRRRLAASHASR